MALRRGGSIESGRPIARRSDTETHLTPDPMKLLLAGCLLTSCLISPALASQAPQPEPESWSHLIWGTSIGKSGMWLSPVGTSREIVFGGGGFGYGNRYWFVTEYSPKTGGLIRKWTSPIYPKEAYPIFLQAGEILDKNQPQVLLGLDGGAVEVWDQAQRKRILRFPTDLTAIHGMALVDLDGKAGREILVSDGFDVLAYDRTGKKLFTLKGVAKLHGCIRVGNVDKDAAPELVTSKGLVIDLKTLTVQWTWTKEFGFDVELADIDGDGMDEIVCYGTYHQVWAYDADTQLPKWSISNDGGYFFALRLDDIDADGTIEVLFASSNNSDIRVYDSKTQKLESKISNPLRSCTEILPVDLVGDKTKELIWGGGWASTGKDELFIGDVKAGTLLWKTRHLDGPFSRYVEGDVDGDGKNELVTVCHGSDSNSNGGCIFVFDADTYELQGVSPAITSSPQGPSVPGVQLIQADTDKQLEIVTLTGKMQIWDYTAPNLWVRKWEMDPGWQNPAQVGLIADLDGKAGFEVAMGLKGYLHIYDHATQVELAKSFYLGGDLLDLQHWDSDSDGSKELLVRSADGLIYIFDSATYKIESVLQPASGTKFQTLSQLRISPKLVLVVTTDDKGRLIVHLPNAGSYTSLPPIPTRKTTSYDIFHILTGDLFILDSHQGQLTLSHGFTPIWTTPVYQTHYVESFFGSFFHLSKHGQGLRLLTNTFFGPVGWDF